MQIFLLTRGGQKANKAARSPPCPLAPAKTFSKWGVKEGAAAFLHLTHRWAWPYSWIVPIFLVLLPRSFCGSGPEMLYYCMDCSFWTFCASHKSWPRDCCGRGILQAVSSRCQTEEGCGCRVTILLRRRGEGGPAEQLPHQLRSTTSDNKGMIC